MKIKENTCENCHKNAKRSFQIIEPGVTYSLNGGDDRTNLSFIFCNSTCARSFAAWMFGPGLTKMPKGWKVTEIVEKKKPKSRKKKAVA